MTSTLHSCFCVLLHHVSSRSNLVEGSPLSSFKKSRGTINILCFCRSFLNAQSHVFLQIFLQYFFGLSHRSQLYSRFCSLMRSTHFVGSQISLESFRANVQLELAVNNVVLSHILHSINIDPSVLAHTFSSYIEMFKTLQVVPTESKFFRQFKLSNYFWRLFSNILTHRKFEPSYRHHHSHHNFHYDRDESG